MEADRWITNIACLLVGILIVFASLSLVLHHQYTYLHQNWLTADPKVRISSFVVLLAGIWLFLIVLVGLIGKRQRKKPDYE